MKKIITLFILSIIYTSCGNNKNESTNNKEIEEQDFEIISFDNSGFHAEPNKKDKGSVFKTELIINNNTGNKITSFEMKYFIEGLFKNKKYEYFPGGGKGSRKDYNELFKTHFLLPVAKLEDLEENQIWLPNEQRKFNLLVKGSLFSYFFKNEEFKRTPEKLNLVIKYEAISVDKEYYKMGNWDILEHWKNYQKEINYR